MQLRLPKPVGRTCELAPVLDGGGAVSLVGQEEGEHAVVVPLGPMLIPGGPIVELAYQGQGLQTT